MEKPLADGTMAEKTATAATTTAAVAGAKVPWRDLDLFLVIVVGVLKERCEVASRSNVMLL